MHEIESLSFKEKEVLTLMASNYTNTEISRRMYMSVSSVKNHLREIFLKLNAKGRVQAAVIAAQKGLLNFN